VSSCTQFRPGRACGSEGGWGRAIPIVPGDASILAVLLSAWFNVVVSMCDKCAELDVTIEHYERIRLSIGDQLTVDRIKELVAEMNAKKAKFHPENEKE
jgi:hypothetical protein